MGTEPAGYDIPLENVVLFISLSIKGWNNAVRRSVDSFENAEIAFLQETHVRNQDHFHPCKL